MTYSYAPKHHKNYNRCYKNYQMGLKMNIAKTKVMVVDNTPIYVNNVLIENVQDYVYLGQHYSLKEKNQDKKIQRRIMAVWAAYAKHRDIFKSNIAICLKRQVYNSCVLPAMTYGADTWTLTKQAQNKLAAAHTSGWFYTSEKHIYYHGGGYWSRVTHCCHRAPPFGCCKFGRVSLLAQQYPRFSPADGVC